MVICFLLRNYSIWSYACDYCRRWQALFFILSMFIFGSDLSGLNVVVNKFTAKHYSLLLVGSQDTLAWVVILCVLVNFILWDLNNLWRLLLFLLNHSRLFLLKLTVDSQGQNWLFERFVVVHVRRKLRLYLFLLLRTLFLSLHMIIVGKLGALNAMRDYFWFLPYVWWRNLTLTARTLLDLKVLIQRSWENCTIFSLLKSWVRCFDGRSCSVICLWYYSALLSIFVEMSPIRGTSNANIISLRSLFLAMLERDNLSCLVRS